MSESRVGTAVIAGIGPGLGGALCRRFAAGGYRVAGLARSGAAADDLSADIRASGGEFAFQPCQLTDEKSVDAALSQVEASMGPASVLIYNAGTFLIESASETSIEQFRMLWEINCLGAFLCARRVLPTMVRGKRGTIVFSGATASIRGGAKFAAFAAGKFALRGLAQSLAREYGPKGIHVAHAIIDGIIDTPRTRELMGIAPDKRLKPAAIAETYFQLVTQDRSAWTLELDVRPDVETF